MINCSYNIKQNICFTDDLGEGKLCLLACRLKETLKHFSVLFNTVSTDVLYVCTETSSPVPVKGALHKNSRTLCYAAVLQIPSTDFLI